MTLSAAEHRAAAEEALRQGGPVVVRVLCARCGNLRRGTVRRTPRGLLWETSIEDTASLVGQIALGAQLAHQRRLAEGAGPVPVPPFESVAAAAPGRAVPARRVRRVLLDLVPDDAALGVLCPEHDGLTTTAGALRAAATRRGSVVVG